MLETYSDSDFKRRLDRVTNVARDSQWQMGTARDSAAPLRTDEALGSHTTSTQHYARKPDEAGLMTPKRHTLQYPAPGTRSGRWGRRGTVLHRPGPTKTTTTTPHPNNIELKAALTLTPDNCRTNRLLHGSMHTGLTKSD
ncbi:hypothetical protein HBI64_000010 [Parastagonospora nodorum]|nr:hypothetical protein HBI64_000010 [Parastagonospora nodorum]